MRKNREIIRLVVPSICALFLTTLIAYARPPSPPVTRENPKVLKARPSATMPRKIYKIELVKFDLTNACRIRLVLQNKGSDLTADQHRKSTLKVGQSQPMSLSVIDPGKRLYRKGGTVTYIEAKPLQTDTNMTVVITLFNGSRKSWTKLLRPNCKRPSLKTKKLAPFQKRTHSEKKGSLLSTPGASKMFQPQPEPPGQPMKPMSNKMAIKFPRPTAIVNISKTILQVKRLGGDLETWDNWGSTDTSLQKMDFRWKTQIESLRAARWQVSLSPDFPYLIANGPISPIPPKGQYGRFSIDFSAFSGTYSKPATFYVRVKPLKFKGVGTSTQSSQEAAQYKPSLPVRITLTEAGAGEQTQFNLPKTHLKVVFQKILVVDDSDDLSGGDLSFRFDVNGIQKIRAYPDDKFDTGDMIPLSNLSFIITSPPNNVRVEVLGCDDDAIDVGEKFVVEGNFLSLYCSSTDPDSATAILDIFTGTKIGRRHIPNKPFNIYAKGSSLKFEVHGYYEMYCDPCP